MQADRFHERGIAAAVAAAGGRDELRVALRPWLLSGRALWLWAEGLGVSAPGPQTRMLRALAPYHRGRARGGRDLEVLVLDWSTSVMPSAEQLAMQAVLGEAFQRTGAHVLGCVPLDPSSALLFTGDASSACQRWVQGDPIARAPGRWQPAAVPPASPHFRVPLAKTVVVSNERGVVAAFLNTLENGLACHGASRQEAALAQSAVIELVANILRHAPGAPAAVAATLSTGSVPVVEIAAADAGPGIARTQASRFGYDLSRVPERHFLGSVFRGAVTGVLELPREERGGGRGIAGIARMIVHEAGGRVTARSGGARLAITGAGEQRDVVSALSHGFGSQLLLEIPLTGHFDARDWY